MQARLLNQSHQQNLGDLMHDIGVDKYGIRIMQPKANLRVIYLDNIASFSANILKQETLSLGADLAIPREALFTKKPVQCLLFATDSQIDKLLKKIKKQPYSLRELGSLIKECLENSKRRKFLIQARERKLTINKPLIMGILNVTSDSFSGDGLLKAQDKKLAIKDLVLKRADEMIREGADWIDVGGESTRPGAKPLKLKDELARAIPAIKTIKKYFPKIPISIDTYKPDVAKEALEEGACIVNDITALRSDRLAKTVARKKAAVILMHMKATPLTMQQKPFYNDVLAEIYGFLDKAIRRAASFGIEKEKTIIDVGIGFGKRLEDNLRLMRYLYEFKSLGRPILIGTSRKSFIGQLLNKANPQDRLIGTITSIAIGIINGAKILRVHDIRQAKEAVKIADSIMSLC
ncbi:MAG: dihydropteroate synthase [Candidatus Omnitrophica bacterium]|nr:dihydropteroate synthase [Candidatus Omnitrophota bacterium]